ncbi:M61 family metallopeptidase [Arsenicibacter rosenii]|uniref:Peptidase M61 n=1 Tax=Arsenicibacter rosenii TaxID=1750698 RepID=A0A1S2VQU8_9BACT|nr:PDZ domain-containing protein [Arsenicibacter rosenii]OIN61141.1 peptidase M61 [Arsenicibacter rosenii]
MNRYLLSALAALTLGAAHAQTIRYDLTFPNAVHHEADISLSVAQLPKQPATFRMSRSSPGRYATHEFGKNIYNVKAFDQNNQPLPINRIDGDVYEVPKHNGFVRVSYTLYGNHPDGTYMGIDPQSIHLNMPATFLWLKGYDSKPVTVHFSLPDGNAGKVATQLVGTNDPYTFTAPNLQYFMDSPTKIGDLIIKEWKRTNADGKPVTFRLALEAAVTDSVATAYAGKIASIVDEAGAVYGEFPAYDYGTYTFIASLNPYVKGDGMEHRNSTMISSGITNFNGQSRTLGVFAHEFFHCWNVERIRPKTLEPFNFEKSNMSNELWFAEGFTQYYGELLMARAGFVTPEEYAGTISGLVFTKTQTPGATQYTPIDASRHAVFVDAGVSIDRNNYVNMFTSYYTYGAAVALALDLDLRQRFGKTLDNYMQAVWKRFGKPEVPYTVDGLQEVLATVTNQDYAAAFFGKYINGHAPIEYAPLLKPVGYTVKPAAPGKAWIGNLRFTDTDKGLIIPANTVKNTPVYKAGLDVDDVIVSVNNQPIKTTDALRSLLSEQKPGDKLTVQYQHRGQTRTTTILTEENPNQEVIVSEKAGSTPSEADVSARTKWVGPQAKH